MLVDHEIAAVEGLIEPFVAHQVKAGNIGYGLSCAGYDCRLGLTVRWPSGGALDPKRPELAQWRETSYREGEPIDIPPGGFFLGVTVERFTFPNDLVGTFLGKSTLARCGILPLVTPAEPGWRGYLTLEIANLSGRWATVYAGEGIGQMQFHRVTPPAVPYGARESASYQDQAATPVAARHKRG
jgi:dCTP deaminase